MFNRQATCLSSHSHMATRRPSSSPPLRQPLVCGKSARTWRTWHALGHIPRPVKIGRSTLWRADELQDWVAAGCPGRDAWEAAKPAARKPSKTHATGA